MTLTQATRRTGEPPGSSLAVSTDGLTKRFGDRTVVDGVNLAIPRGSVCGFVGPNGAGKTTTLRMLLGLIRPTSGRGSILGGSLTDPASYLHKVGALIESPAFYPQLSGRDNLKALTRLGQIPAAVIDPTLERTGMTARAGDLVAARLAATPAEREGALRPVTFTGPADSVDRVRRAFHLTAEGSFEPLS